MHLCRDRGRNMLYDDEDSALSVFKRGQAKFKDEAVDTCGRLLAHTRASAHSRRRKVESG
eukprot:6213187-Pleurochrysis_carterae.AAC.4